MMTPDAHLHGPVRVSILERIVPSIAFTVAAISGAVGGLMIFRLFSTLRQAESAGREAFLGAMSEIEFVVAGILVFSAVLGALGIVVSIVRLFTTNATASPPGFLFLMLGLLSLLPPFGIHYVLHMMKAVVIGVASVPEGGISAVGDTIDTVSYLAIGAAVGIALLMIVFTFIPFSSRAGRKSSTLICLVIVEIFIAILIGVYFWEARVSLAERDKTTIEEDQLRESNDSTYDTPDTNTYDANSVTNVYGDDDRVSESNTNSGRPKVISGGVLNSKAISLPQPAYPTAARAVRASGSVSVQVLVDEKGEVISATAVSGHPLLRASAVQAARQARFAPSKLSGQTVRASGIITYNFSLE